MIVVDFETEAIQARPEYPPRPVGVAIKEPGKKGRYLAWGHPTKNTTSMDKARALLSDLWRRGPLLFHNAKFDLDVAQTWLQLPMPAWHDYHDTLFLLFLLDPHADSISLKPAAERWLKWKPEEQDAVRAWLVANRVIPSTRKDAGAFIAKAPGDVVGPYAVGDVERTAALFDLLYPRLDEGMRGAYDRERKLMPILLQNEREGIRVDADKLEHDLKVYERALMRADEWLCKRLKSPGLNLDADADVAAALRARGVVTDFAKTKTGRDSTSKKNLTPDKFKDQNVAHVMGYRNRLQTVLANSMRPWLEQARINDGYIATAWNQVRSTEGFGAGTRTGRLSCSRFQNITKSFEDKGDGYQHPKVGDLPPLPLVRRYLVPDPRQRFVHRDYNQQEFRILAHYENDQLLAAYLADPRTDYHTLMQKLIFEVTGLKLERRPVKILNFGINYGMGAGKLAVGLGVDVDTAVKLRQAQKRAVPGVADLDRELKRRGREGEPIRTWGGRLYYCEPPKLVAGQMRSFEYKLLNYLIQGSAADCTKEAIIRYHEHPRKEGRFLVTVHDEINVSADSVEESKVLAEAMESIEFDVPMLTDGKVGSNWGELK